MLFAFAWALVFYSCREVSFNAAQPAGIDALKEVPEVLRGKFQPAEITADDRKDTLIIEPWGYHLKDDKNKDWLGKGVLSDSLVIKSYQGYYFVNFRLENQWILRIVKQNKAGGLEVMSIDISTDEKRTEVLKKLSKRFKVKEVKHKDDTFYQISPTPSQLILLINEGYFTNNELKRLKK